MLNHYQHEKLSALHKKPALQNFHAKNKHYALVVKNGKVIIFSKMKHP